MRFDIITLFPELFERFVELGVVGRAIRGGALSVRLSKHCASMALASTRTWTTLRMEGARAW
jgi:tRNA G37 N-methylase TrmD